MIRCTATKVLSRSLSKYHYSRRDLHPSPVHSVHYTLTGFCCSKNLPLPFRLPGKIRQYLSDTQCIFTKDFLLWQREREREKERERERMPNKLPQGKVTLERADARRLQIESLAVYWQNTRTHQAKLEKRKSTNRMESPNGQTHAPMVTN